MYTVAASVHIFVYDFLPIFFKNFICHKNVSLVEFLMYSKLKDKIKTKGKLKWALASEREK